MLHFLVGNSIQILHQALLAVLVAAALRRLSRRAKVSAGAVGRLFRRIKTSVRRLRTRRFRIDLGMASAAVVIAIGSTREERKSFLDGKSDDRDR